MDVTGVEGFREIAFLEVWVKVGRPTAEACVSGFLGKLKKPCNVKVSCLRLEL